MTYHFPDAYAGQNTKIRDTLNSALRAPHLVPRAPALTHRLLLCRPHPQEPAELADVDRPALLSDRGDCCGVGRGQVRRPPDATGSVRRREQDADEPAPQARTLSPASNPPRPNSPGPPCPCRVAAQRDRVVRRGLALIIESDFYATDAGRQHFADQLTSIRYCVQETCSARRGSNPFLPARMPGRACR